MVNPKTESNLQSLQMPVHHLVGRSRAARKLAWVLAAFLVLLPILLVFVPWQQNVPGTGRLTAYKPTDRIQVIPAPITGRLLKLNVQEGSRVNEGDELAVMEDLDPDFSLRLDQQLEFAREKVESAHQSLEALDAQLISLEESRVAGMIAARAAARSAEQKVREAEEKQTAAEKKLSFLTEDYGRQTRLFAKGQASEQSQQKAEAEYGAQLAEVERAKAAVAGARNERDSKEAAVDKVAADQQGKIDEVNNKVEEAKQKLQDSKKAETVAASAQARQATRLIRSPRSGTVLRAPGANSSDLISRGEPLMEIIPDTEDLAVEMWMRGIDAPLVEVGRKARMQFEGWPAVQFAGWPSVAVGTFGGIVSQVDAQAAADGRVRVLIVPDPKEDPWPDRQYLRQGVRANGWVQLNTVSSGYELWRQLNAFPPSVGTGPTKASGKKSKASKEKQGGDGGAKTGGKS